MAVTSAVEAFGASCTVLTTRALPANGVASVVFAVGSCARYSEGFFHAFGAAAKSDAQYAVHLGGYIDKHGPDLDKDERPKYGNIIIPSGCITTPPNDIVSMNGYRSRHAQNKLDLNLQAPHAAHAGHPHQRP